MARANVGRFAVQTRGRRNLIDILIRTRMLTPEMTTNANPTATRLALRIVRASRRPRSDWHAVLFAALVDRATTPRVREPSDSLVLKREVIMNFDDIQKRAAVYLPTNVTAYADDFSPEETRDEMRRVVRIVMAAEMLLDSAGFPRAPEEFEHLSALWRCAHVADVMRENAALKAEVARLNRIVDDPDMMDRADRRWWSLYEKASECRNKTRGGFGRHRDTGVDVVALARAEARYRRAMARCERIQKGEPAFQVEVSA